MSNLIKIKLQDKTQFIKSHIREYLLIVFLVSVTEYNYCQQNHLNVSKLCSFSYDEKVEKACSSGLNIDWENIQSNDTLMMSLTNVIKANALDTSVLHVGILGNLLVAGLYCKSKDDDIPRIFIGKKYVNNYWVAIGILLHEMGHVLNHHENVCSNKQLELDADLFAGRCLAYLNATKDQALQCMNVESVDIISNVYPTKEERIKQLLTGYTNFFKRDIVMSFTSINPQVRWQKYHDSTLVYIDNIKISIPHYRTINNNDTKKIVKLFGYRREDNLGFSFDSQIGILYIDSTNSTYQLTNYESNTKGIGQLVNDKTPITYMRFGSNSFRIYNKARIIPFKEVKDVISNGNGIDYEILYKINPTDSIYTTVVFSNYFFTPNGILMPAFFK